jgi:putative hydrolase of the HAD superfamily
MRNRTIAFDADDTLWVNETIFTNTRDKFKLLIEQYTDVSQLEDRLYRTEMQNLSLFGYGIKGFTLSMIETAIDLTREQISGRDIQQIMAWCKDMLAHPVDILDAVEDTLKELREEYQLMVITKGDLFDQETKIARSGLGTLFDFVEIVSEKDEKTYSRILRKHNIPLRDFIMVGNSVKSDILPICALGGRAVYIPFHTTWAHEQVSREHAATFTFETLEAISQLPALLKRIWP